MITRRAILVASAFWLCAFSAFAQQPPASAADTASARELFREAARLAQDGRWQEAKERYERSMALRPSNLTRYSLALTQKETGHLVEAMENLRAFLRVTDDPSLEPYRSTAVELLASIEPRIAYVRISIRGPIPAGLELLVDAQPVAQAAFGVERPIDPGSRNFQVKAPGFKTRNESLNFSEAEHKAMDITLEAEAVSENSPAAVKAGSTEAPPVNSESPSSSSWGPGLLIGGGVAILSGLGLGVLGYSKASGATTRDGSDADSARSLALAGDITMALGLAASTAGLWIVLSPTATSNNSATLAPWMSPSSVGLSGQGCF